MLSVNTFNILIAGPAGTGVEAVSHSLALHFTREGLFVHTHSEYENRIRGGNNYSQVRISDAKLTAHSNSFDVMIAMNKNSITSHLNEMKEGGAIVYDGEKIKMDGIEVPENIHMISIPANSIAEEVGLKLAANIVAVGALFALIGKKDDAFFSVIESQFSKKGNEIIQINKKALEKGYKYVQENFKERVLCNLEGDGGKRTLLFGNESIALGCIKAGMKFLAAYPMTPGSTIMTALAKESRNYDIVVSHVEDEIAAVNMAIGAGATGIRAATSTSGGGFALMSEAVSFSGMTESPVVIFNAQRLGQSTGLPTRTAQADLRMAMHCGQGDFPRLVIALGDQEECVRLTVDAFNYAEKFQIPVIVLTEKYIADSYKSIEMDVCDGLKIERGEIVDS
ncbi:2-oxoacid:acceptor oxidoreductase subunit alpha, partial [Candidatus Peregrinibacteria bacterium]|nr:2-oxoacid:acceptor oxidoreductase subunit alpha [Candidatus Peregrinibacteria bacterium]